MKAPKPLDIKETLKDEGKPDALITIVMKFTNDQNDAIHEELHRDI
jgi:hypothetical protein